MIRVLGQDVELRAKVEIINGYSAHADRTELAKWIGAVRAKSPRLGQVCLVHGEPAAQEALTEALVAQAYTVISPTAGDTITC